MIKTTLSHVDDIEPTRAELKRRMDRLQDLGKRLTELPSGKLVRLQLPEKLKDAVIQAQKLTSMGAKRRQLQYIGRIMEEFDAAAISRDLRDVDIVKLKKEAQPLISPAVQIAEALIAGGDEALYSLHERNLNHADIQQIRQGLRAARKALAAGASHADEAAKLAKICSHFVGT